MTPIIAGNGYPSTIFFCVRTVSRSDSEIDFLSRGRISLSNCLKKSEFLEQYLRTKSFMPFSWKMMLSTITKWQQATDTSQSVENLLGVTVPYTSTRRQGGRVQFNARARISKLDASTPASINVPVKAASTVASAAEHMQQSS